MSELFDAKVTPKDTLYGNIRDLPKYSGYKAFAELLWKDFRSYADSTHFLSQIHVDFHARFWEMYLFNALFDKGHVLGACRKNHGPDLFIENGSEKIWIEAVTAKKGVGPDAPEDVDAGLTEISPGFRSSLAARSLSDDQIVLRYRTAISKKLEKYTGYLGKNIVHTYEPFVIALNGADIPFDFVKDELPRIVKALFALGNIQCTLNMTTMEIVSTGYEYKPSIIKKSGDNVTTDIFLNDQHEGISAILYSCENIANRTLPIGSGFVLIHNPYAKNPLPQGYLKTGIEYWVEAGELKFLGSKQPN